MAGARLSIIAIAAITASAAKMSQPTVLTKRCTAAYMTPASRDDASATREDGSVIRAIAFVRGAVARHDGLG